MHNAVRSREFVTSVQTRYTTSYELV